MRTIILILVLCILAPLFSCSKPLIDARLVERVEYYSRDYAALPNDVYYAIRWALKEHDYPVDKEEMQTGTLLTSWVPVTSDSHFVPVFGRRDYGVTNSYYQLDVQVVGGEPRTVVKVASRAKGLVSNLRSSGIEEKKILDGIGNYLRKQAPDITNLGVNE